MADERDGRSGEEDWTPPVYVSGAERARGEGSIFDPGTASKTPEGPQAFVTGWPVWQSRSPLIHRTWLAEYGLPGSYGRVGVPPEEIDEFLRGIRTHGYVGGNVTVPHKVVAHDAVGRRDAAAEAIGAVNTLWFEDDVLVGGNTDAHGFAANLDERLDGWTSAEEAVVLGAGGAARAVIFALLDRGISRVRIVNRTLDRARELSGRFGARVSAHGLDERAAQLAVADLVVNTVPPAKPDPDEEALPPGFEPKLPDLSALRAEAMVTNIVYFPLRTPLLRAAEARGLRTADGLGMLIHQAVPGFERWFGHRPTVSASLRERLERDIEMGV